MNAGCSSSFFNCKCVSYSSYSTNFDAAMTAAKQNSSDTTFTNTILGLLVLCFYWIEFYKCFNLVLLLAVPLLVYINLVEPIVRVTRYFPERHFL